MNPNRRPFIAAAAALALVLSLTACDNDSGPTGPDIDPNDIIADAFIEQAGDVVTTGSGLQFLQVEEGTGPEAEPGDSVVVHFRGQRTDGVEFDNSYDDGDPLGFVLRGPGIPRGFTEGVDRMREGGTAKLLLPPNIAFGNNVTVAFEVELVEVFPADPTDPDNVIAEAFEEQAGDVVTTESGLRYLQVEEGTGAAAMPGDSVFVHYRGQFANGVEFDNSYAREQPLAFVLGSANLIPGFSEGVALMKEGGEAKLLLPPDLAYGPFGSQSRGIIPQTPIIPPGTTIYFDIELVDVR